MIFEEYTLEELMFVLDYIKDYSVNLSADVYSDIQRDYLINVVGGDVYDTGKWDAVHHEEWFRENMSLPLIWMEECYGELNYYELLHMYVKFAVDNRLKYDELADLSDAVSDYLLIDEVPSNIKVSKIWKPLISVLPVIQIIVKAFIN